jgi:hypothetical protein
MCQEWEKKETSARLFESRSLRVCESKDWEIFFV